MKNNKLALLVAFFVSCTLAFSGCSKIGFVSDSSVTSADATASAVRNTIVNFLSDADAAGYGMLEGAETVIEITVDNSSWTVYAADVSSFKQSESVTWGTEQDGIKANESKESVSSAERLLGISLANNKQLDDKTFQLAPYYYIEALQGGFDYTGEGGSILITLP